MIVTVMMMVVILAHEPKIGAMVPACRAVLAAQSGHVFVTPICATRRDSEHAGNGH
ncbi:hypothetical protein [Bradyrhizobium sp. USDA 4486]